MSIPSSARLSRLARNIFLALGAVLLVLLFRAVGWREILLHLRLVGWGLIPFIGIHALKEALTTSAWRVNFPEARGVRWWRLYFITWMGHAVNRIYHTGIAGGMAARILLVRRNVPTTVGIASVVIHQLSQALADMIFVMSGIAFVLPVLDLPGALEAGLLATFAVLLLLICLFWLLQRRGLFGKFVSALRRLPLSSRFLDKLQQKTDLVDQALSTYHSSQNRAFQYSVGLNVVRLFLNLAQVQVVLYLIGVPGGFMRCFIISVFSILVNALFFFIPGRLGIQEGGKVVIARALGMTTAQGLTLGIVSRLALIIWSSFGLVLLVFWRRLLAEPAAVREGEPV